MKKHPHRQDMYDAALDLIAGDKLQGVLDHMVHCRECAAKYERLLLMLKPSDNSDVMPSEGIERRLIGSYRAMQKPAKRTFPALLRPLALGAAASIIVIVGVYFSLFRDGREGNIDMAAVNISGSFMINEMQAGRGAGLTAGSLLETGRESRAEIGLRENFSIFLASQSRLAVDEARYDRESKHKIFAFGLSRGAVYARFRHNEPGLEYSFHTPRALIHSIGTQFLLQAEEKTTTILLTEGRLKITSTETGETIELTEGNRCVITLTMQTGAMTAADKKEIMALTRGFESAAEHAVDNKKSLDHRDEAKPGEEKMPDADDDLLENGGRPVDGDELVPGKRPLRHNREMREMRREIRERRQVQRANRLNQ